tara:strand:- start:264 stop:590 length:327 start_codon:yes stop_codon:yes gene_type:complete
MCRGEKASVWPYTPYEEGKARREVNIIDWKDLTSFNSMGLRLYPKEEVRAYQHSFDRGAYAELKTPFGCSLVVEVQERFYVSILKFAPVSLGSEAAYNPFSTWALLFL